MDYEQTKGVGQVMHIGSPNIHGLTLPPGSLPPDPTFLSLVVVAPGVMIFLLSFLYHLIKGDFKSDSEFLAKSIVTWFKLLVVYFVVVAIATYIWPMGFYG
ncbi:MAG: hypothetical protein ACFE8Z_11780 [Candidatus Hermodarchaeota archaeon]